MGGEPGTQRFVGRIVGCQAPVPRSLEGSRTPPRTGCRARHCAGTPNRQRDTFRTMALPGSPGRREAVFCPGNEAGRRRASSGVAALPIPTHATTLLGRRWDAGTPERPSAPEGRGRRLGPRAASGAVAAAASGAGTGAGTGTKAGRCRCLLTLSLALIAVPAAVSVAAPDAAADAAPVPVSESLNPGLLVRLRRPSVAPSARSLGWWIEGLRPRRWDAGGLLPRRERCFLRASRGSPV